MKLKACLIPALLSVTTMSATAIELTDINKSAIPQLSSASKDSPSEIKSNAMISYAAKELNLSEETVAAGFGSLLKVAKGYLSQDNFAFISKAVPDADNYLAKAPKVSSSPMTSLLSKSGSSGKKADSLNYLNSAFEKLGIPKEYAPKMLDLFSGYLDKSGYGEAAKQLKGALSIL